MAGENLAQGTILVKTMVPRARSTLDGHPEVKQGRTTGFSRFWLT